MGPDCGCILPDSMRLRGLLVFSEKTDSDRQGSYSLAQHALAPRLFVVHGKSKTVFVMGTPGCSLK